MFGWLWLYHIRPAFVDDLKAHLKRYSVICLGLLASLQTAWIAMPPEIRNALPERFVTVVSIALAIGGFIGGLLKQNLRPSDFGLDERGSVRIWPAVVFGAVAVLWIGLFGTLVSINGRLTLRVKHADQCLSAVKSDDYDLILLACDAPIIDLARVKARSEACEKALELGAVAPECAAQVAALAINNEALKTQLEATQADQSAAISRAEVRAKTHTNRKIKDDRAMSRALAAAPTDADGLVVCDFGCLRARFTDN
jgi:hypothetical protein